MFYNLLEHSMLNFITTVKPEEALKMLWICMSCTVTPTWLSFGVAQCTLYFMKSKNK